MASFHPDDDVLVSFSAGTLNPALHLAVASHLSLCSECREAVSRLDGLHESFIENLEPAALSETTMQAILAAAHTPREGIPTPHTEALFPPPLKTYLDNNPPRWESRSKGVRQAILFKETDGTTCSLLALRAGTILPEHSHNGAEYVLMLEGSMIDARGTARRGDFVFSDTSLKHAPRAGDDEDCLCLVVSRGGLKFTKGLMRVLNVLPWQ